MKNRQKGAFLMARRVLLVLILVGMLVAPIWLKRSYGDKDKGRAGTCNFLLPVLCLTPGAFVNPAPPGANPVGSWISSTLSATAPVMWAILDSQETADPRCEKELGAGYHMAGRYSGGDGMALRGRPGQGLGVSSATRYWVATKGEPGNRWGTARLDALAAQQLCST